MTMAGALDRLFAPDDAARSPRGRAIRAFLFALWLVLVIALARHHVMWRDEVRALTLAGLGEDLPAMLRAARGYGHPLLWHLVLRGGLAVLPYHAVLPVMALVVAAAAMALLCFATRLSWPILALVLFSGFGAYGYSVVARNYGLSLLLMLLFAERYPAWRDKGLLRAARLGAILALLCNANVHSVLIAGGLLLFWLAEILLGDHGLRRRRLPAWGIAALLVLLGAGIAVWSVYPSVEDLPGAVPGRWPAILVQLIPGIAFARIFGNFLTPWPVMLAAALLVPGSLALFARRPAALIAAVVTTALLQLLFVFVYSGHYRHVALLIPFLLVLHLMTAHVSRRGGRYGVRAERWGKIAFLLLLLGQWPATARAVVQSWRGQPESEAAALGRLLHRPDLSDAILLAEPDFLIETLPYYGLPNGYSMRQGRFATLVPLRLADSAPMSPTRLLEAAKALGRARRRPVVILMTEPLDAGAPGRTIDRGPFGPLRLEQAEVRRFLSATERLARLRGASGDENYDVFLVRDSCPPTRACLASPRDR
ncbi:hypothetical protein [uncultured Sphingomonas sp.]|uniref:hypothetical protein n=1 Tax=uncultured Sphingomonas sp. TaxID=158754 RepID=UPI0025DC9A3C|nr:hypothetical protein [uncultured Sphingomonas sp.]